MQDGIGRRILIGGAAALAFLPRHAAAKTRAEINRGVDETLARLFRAEPEAKALAERAVGILVFPEILKAGLMIGGEYGEGALREGRNTVGYYRLTAASYGLQAGAQRYSYVMMLMTPEARRYIDRSDGWEVGTGPSVVLMDKGMAKRMSSTTVTQDVLAFIFGQSGIMGGLGLQGSKISRFQPSR
ncbi:YSC84-related protein [Elioraea sp.]|uniref:lipid-binding SYLF domain-containing protein n=1 Tax=Elioraea sp. TaxID=2185103 RepID=UPI0025B9AC09|nr:YSC84-related protein [Elioraea sp.]